MATVSIRTPEDVANLTLRRIGYPGPRIENMMEGSRASSVILDVYGQTRDALITEGEWEFAERIVTGKLLKQAPQFGYIMTPWTSAYPDLPWLFSYAYPDDALKIRSVRATPLQIPNFAPQHNIYSLGNDNGFNPPQQVILCNVPNAMITYAARVDDPTTWQPLFAEELATAIARRVESVLMPKDGGRMAVEEDNTAESLAAMTKG